MSAAERITITQSEILDAIAASAAGTAPDDARTLTELADDTGVSLTRLRETLRALKAAGRLRVYPVKREGLDGRQSSVKAYAVTPSQEVARTGKPPRKR